MIDGHITSIAEKYPNGVHWEAVLLPMKVRFSELKIGWIELIYVNDKSNTVYHCKVEEISTFEWQLNELYSLKLYWSVEIDEDNLVDLHIGQVKYDYSPEHISDEYESFLANKE